MKPLLISDCDEVLMSFAGPFGEHLEDVHGMRLSFDSFALSGNIRHIADGSIVADEEMPGLLSSFFRTGMHRQVPAPGVQDALASLEAHFDIVILTNVEDEHRDRRREQLRAVGIDYEVYCNRGPKGPALKRILGEHGGPPAVFIDDLPPHHRSVKSEAGHVHSIHMVADPALRKIIPTAEAADARIDDWPEARDYLERLIREESLAPGVSGSR